MGACGLLRWEARCISSLDMCVRAARGADGGAAAALGAAAPRLFGCPSSAAARRAGRAAPAALNVIRKLLAGGAASGGRFSTRGRAISCLVLGPAAIS